MSTRPALYAIQLQRLGLIPLGQANTSTPVLSYTIKDLTPGFEIFRACCSTNITFLGDYQGATPYPLFPLAVPEVPSEEDWCPYNVIADARVESA